jgi:O-antigen ligase
MKSNIHLIYIFILWFSACLSLNAYPIPFQEIILFIKNPDNFSDNTNTTLFFGNLSNPIYKKISWFVSYLRSHFFSALLPLTIIIILLNWKKLVMNTFVTIYIIYFILQLFGTIITTENGFSFQRHFLLINAIHIIFFAYTITIFNLEKYLKIFFIISLTALGAIVFVHLYFLTIDYFNQTYHYLYNNRLWDTLIFNNAFIRVTGLSRSLTLIFIVLFFLYHKNNLSFYAKILVGLSLFILMLFIWWLQSRTSIIMAPLIVLIMYVMLLTKKKYKFSISKSIFLFSLFALLSFNIPNYLYALKSKLLQNNDLGILQNTEKTRLTIKKNISSGRYYIWRLMLEKYDKKKFFGYGTQGDRFYLGTYVSEKIGNPESDKDFYYNNSSNAFLHALITGGYLGFFVFIMLNIYILKKIYFLLIKKNEYKNFVITSSSIVILFFLMIRSLVENTYALFSVDMFFFYNLFLNCYF